jgi:hypothetical protein
MSTTTDNSQQKAHVVALDGSEDADKAFVWALRNLVRDNPTSSLISNHSHLN